MCQKLYKLLNALYGILMSISFFSGFLPLIPFVVAIIIGGDIGEAIAVFLSREYYPWVIVVGSIALLIGLIAMYVGKREALSVKNVSAESDQKK